MPILEEITEAAGRVLAAAGPSVVRVGRDDGRGAGIVVAEGSVVTSAHNLRGPQITVTFSDGEVVTGEVRGVDADGDVAVVAAATGSRRPIEWSAGAGPAVGAPVFALGLPAGGGSARVTFGTVSATDRSFRGPRGRLIVDSVEHTAPVGRGSSGGPLVDGEGRLLAVNTHRLGDGLYLALPATPELRSRVDALSRGEAPARRRLGVALAPPHVARRLRAAVGLAPREGVLVREVDEDGPGAAAGLKRGDLIVDADGRAISSIDDLLGALDAAGSGGSLALKVVRGDAEVDVTVRFGA
ncbi:MAG: S1C family serine protease [Acidimicrobiales bacterium]